MKKSDFIAKLLLERKNLIKSKNSWCPGHACFSVNK